MKTVSGCLVKVGENFYVKWVKNGKPKQVRLSDENGNPITIRADAELAKDKFMAPFRFQSNTETLQHLEAEVKIALGKADATLDKDNPDTFFTNALTTFLKQPNRNDSSPDILKHYGYYWGKFFKFVSAKNPQIKYVKEIDFKIVNAYAIFLKEKNYAPSFFNRQICFLRYLFKIIKRVCNLENNPFDDIAFVRKQKNEICKKNNFTKEQVTDIINNANGKYEYLRLLFIVGSNTGLRLGDCCNLKWETIHLDKGYIKLIPGKTELRKGKLITVPLLDQLKEELDKVPVKNRIGYVMPDIQKLYNTPTVGSRLCTKLQAYFHNICDIRTNGDLEGRRIHGAVLYGFHSFRHYWISECFEMGIAADIIQSVVGHAALAMTNYYNHVSDDRMLAAFGKASKKIDAGKIQAVIDGIAEQTTAEEIKTKLLELLK